MLLGLGEDRFLSTAAVVEEEHAMGRARLVGNQHAVLVIEGPRFEQIQLQRFLGLSAYPAAHEKKPVGGRPTGRFPVTFEVGAVLIKVVPALA